MARNAGISARISGDPKPLKQAQDTALADTQSWVNRMVGLNQSIQKSYSSLAFSGIATKQKSPIAMMADQDAKAWARRMQDNQRNSQAFNRGAYGGAGGGAAILQTAQAVDDLQYGIKGVLNNIPGLVMALGGGAGLAGVLALVAVGAATVGKRFWDMWTNAARLKEVTGWVKELDEKLKSVARESEKDALTGTAEGAKALADAVERANEAMARQQQEIMGATARTKEMVQAEAELAAAKAGGDGPGAAKAQRTIEVEQSKALHRATIEQMKAEHEAHGQRAMALDEYAKKVEAAAAVARDKANSLGAGADPFVASTTVDKAAAAEVDAANARAAADKAHTDSVREQMRISEEITHRQKVHAKELATLWIQVDERVAAAETGARNQAAAVKQAQEEAAAATEEKRQKEEQAAQDANRRRLEGMQKDLQRQIRDRDDEEEGGSRVRGVDGPDRSRRINAKAKRARRGFGVDDVHRYQRGPSLRGEMDANIGPVGGRRATAATDRQAHQMQLQKQNQGGDPLLSALAKVEKQLEQINQNTSGMQKSKSEALVRQ